MNREDMVRLVFLQVKLDGAMWFGHFRHSWWLNLVKLQIL